MYFGADKAGDRGFLVEGGILTGLEVEGGGGGEGKGDGGEYVRNTDM